MTWKCEALNIKVSEIQPKINESPQSQEEIAEISQKKAQ